MEESGWVRATWWLGIFTVGAIGAAITTPHHIGPAILAVILGAATARCWYLSR